MVGTVLGQVVGTREEAVDPRQNTTVAWTAYYVTPTHKPDLDPRTCHTRHLL